MQDLENNMDELFRKAAENYQIKPGESDWNDVFPRLDQAVAYITKKKDKSKKNVTISLLLLLFVCTSAIFVKYILTASEPSVVHKKLQKHAVDQPGEEKNNMDMLSNKKQSEKQSTAKFPYSAKDYEQLNGPSSSLNKKNISERTYHG